MSVSEQQRPVKIRYIARNSSTKSDNSLRKSFAFTSYNNSNQQEPDTNFMTLEEDSRDDAFDSAKEADEEDDDKLTHISSQKQPINSISEENIIEEEAIQYRGVAEEPNIIFSTSTPISEKADLTVEQSSTSRIFHVSYKAILSQICHIYQRYYSLPFLRLRLIAGFSLLLASPVLPSFLTGFLLGIYISLLIFLFLCVSDQMPKTIVEGKLNQKLLEQVTMNEIRQDETQKIYKGWMNILNQHYHPHTFHVNTIQTVLIRLDGNLLRISRPEKAMLKHCFHTDPTLNESEPRMTGQNIYDLAGATVKIRPRRLARRRWFSRKYPICIKLAKVNDPINVNGDSELNETRLGRKRKDRLNQSHSEKIESLPERMPMKSMGTLETSESNEEASEFSSDEELPIRHSLSDFTLAPRHNSLVRDRAKKHSGRYIFLFARSTREKERWFHSFRKASSKYKPEISLSNVETQKRRLSFNTLEDLTQKMSKDYLLYSLQEYQFTKQIELLISQMRDIAHFANPTSGTIVMDLGLNKWDKPSADCVDDKFIMLVNLIATRIFYDFCRDKYWCDAVRNKIQTKLATIHLPYFIETLELSTFDLGTSIPEIVKVYKPTVDDWGIWFDFEIKYNGLIKLGLETRVNLMKLKSASECGNSEEASSSQGGNDNCQMTSFSTSILRTTPSRYSDEEMPESPETSPDEEFGAKLKDFTSKRQKTGQKILSLVDRFAHTKYFREAIELKPIRKVMEEISSTRLMLNVEVTRLEGILACNLPPPPSDRLWYGFRQPPQMSMRAIPQVGDRSVVYSALSEWIENKLQLILEKNLVLPNMDDVVIPIMSGNQLLQANLNR